MNKRILVSGLVGTVLGIMAAHCMGPLAHSENWEASGPPECFTEEHCAKIDLWYTLTKMNNGVTSCCGKADAYYADKAEVIDGKYYVIITDDRKIPKRVDRNGQKIEIPTEKIDNLKQGNPTGHTIVFISNTDTVYCFFPLNLS